MLTADENIIDIQFEVQYRIKNGGAPSYLFSNSITKNNDTNHQANITITQAAESVMRAEIGKYPFDAILNQSNKDITTTVQSRLQNLLDRYTTRRTDIAGEHYFDSGILITGVVIHAIKPPDNLQTAFDEVAKAIQEKDNSINEAQAHTKEITVVAQRNAARLVAEAEHYKQRVIQTAEGDVARFKSVLAEYSKAPAITRQRMYLDTMQQVFQSTSKIVIDTKNNGSSNMMYLPLDKIISQTTNPDAQRPPETHSLIIPSNSTPTNITTPTPKDIPKDAAKETWIRTRDLRDLR
jgi:membrane protease subunit HflK